MRFLDMTGICSKCHGKLTFPTKSDMCHTCEWESHIRPEIRTLCNRGDITVKELENIRGNSWEWEEIVLHLDNEALVERARYYIEQCRYGIPENHPAHSYDEGLIYVVVPVLLKRMKTLMLEKTELDDEEKALLRDIFQSYMVHDIIKGHCCPVEFELAHSVLVKLKTSKSMVYWDSLMRKYPERFPEGTKWKIHECPACGSKYRMMEDANGKREIKPFSVGCSHCQHWDWSFVEKNVKK